VCVCMTCGALVNIGAANVLLAITIPISGLFEQLSVIVSMWTNLTTS